jgi:hypothetical protein
MASSNLLPAFRVVTQLGGVCATARIVGCTPGAVSRWTIAKVNCGTGGRIPQRHWPLILRHARAQRIKIGVKELAGL